jgi:hypothetical protein
MFESKLLRPQSANAAHALPDQTWSRELQALLELFSKSTHRRLVHDYDVSDTLLVFLDNPNRYVFGHHMALIFLAGPCFRLILKAHYSVKGVEQLVARTLKRQPDKIEEKTIHDFMREFLNLVAGGCKTMLGEIGIPMGLSLPLVSRGFDEIYYRRKVRDSAVLTDWEVHSELFKVTFTLVCEVIEWKELEKLNVLIGKSESPQYDVEFF